MFEVQAPLLTGVNPFGMVNIEIPPRIGNPIREHAAGLHIVLIDHGVADEAP